MKTKIYFKKSNAITAMANETGKSLTSVQIGSASLNNWEWADDAYGWACPTTMSGETQACITGSVAYAWMYTEAEAREKACEYMAELLRKDFEMSEELSERIVYGVLFINDIDLLEHDLTDEEIERIYNEWIFYSVSRTIDLDEDNPFVPEMLRMEDGEMKLVDNVWVKRINKDYFICGV